MSVKSFKTDVDENRVSFVRGECFASILKIGMFGKNSGKFRFVGRERTSERAMIFVVYLRYLQWGAKTKNLCSMTSRSISPRIVRTMHELSSDSMPTQDKQGEVKSIV